MQVAIVDYGVGNLHSVENAFTAVASDLDVVVTTSPDVIAQADKLVFPGVGAIGHCVDQLAHSGLTASIKQALAEKPVLAICIGMQMLFEKSSESGGVQGLGIFSGAVERFDQIVHTPALTVPHMGWSKVRQQVDHPIWHNVEQGERFYFVHSYRVAATSAEHCLATTDYGSNFVSAVYQDNLIATQFHPEKSGVAGLQLIKNFTRL